jgi:succinyl-CoA synthetase beta subunit
LTLPTDKNTIETALSGLKVNRLLTGYRNNPKGDRDALIDAIMKIAGFIAANTETLEELDINPLMVLPEGSGVVAADALIKRRVRS